MGRAAYGWVNSNDLDQLLIRKPTIGNTHPNRPSNCRTIPSRRTSPDSDYMRSPMMARLLLLFRSDGSTLARKPTFGESTSILTTCFELALRRSCAAQKSF